MWECELGEGPQNGSGPFSNSSPTAPGPIAVGAGDVSGQTNASPAGSIQQGS